MELEEDALIKIIDVLIDHVKLKNSNFEIVRTFAKLDLAKRSFQDYFKSKMN